MTPRPRLTFGIAPVVEYDHNINGGFPVDEISIGPFTFVVDPESRARSGLTFGLRADAGASLAVADGLLFTLSAYGTARHSFEHVRIPRHPVGGSNDIRSVIPEHPVS